MSEQNMPAIPGEPRLTERLREAAGRDALGHALILSGQGDLAAAARFAEKTGPAASAVPAGRCCGASIRT